MGEPLSPVEAILQNILGADNILVPPGSQVEEILQAIYYNTEYEKNPKSRVAEILLAIKNKGVYDGPVLSRVEDILVHKLNNIPYTKHKKEDLSRVEQLLLDWLEQGGGEEIIEYTGTFPMTILANGEPLLDYLISGNTVQSGTPTPDNPIMPQGTGERTGNLAKYWKAAYVATSGTVNANRVNGVSFPVKLEAGQTVTFTNQKTNFGRGIAIFSGFDGETLTGMIYRSTNNTVTYTADSDCYVIIWGNYDNTTSMDESVFVLCDQMLNFGSEALPYEPYGYKLDISSGGENLFDPAILQNNMHLDPSTGLPVSYNNRVATSIYI